MSRNAMAFPSPSAAKSNRLRPARARLSTPCTSLPLRPSGSISPPPPPAGADARAYLNKRGLTPATVEAFGLGLSDRSGQDLLRRLKQQFPPDHLEVSGLIGKRQDGTYYDRFRGRLMFPIHDESGRVIAFGGRALADGDEPKYLNSPE